MDDTKKNVKNMNPEDYEQLKQYCIEEWNKINPKNYLKNFLKRVKMVLKINGNRLEDWHLKQISEVSFHCFWVMKICHKLFS